MRRFSLLLIVLFSAFIFVVRQGGWPSFTFQLFTDVDGSACQRPCALGIRLGVTPIGDAITLLREHPLTHDMTVQWTVNCEKATGCSDKIAESLVNGTIYYTNSRTPLEQLWIVFKNGLVDSLEMSFHSELPGAPMLGDFIALFGYPETLASARGGTLQTNSRFLKSGLFITTQHIRVDTPAYSDGNRFLALVLPSDSVLSLSVTSFTSQSQSDQNNRWPGLRSKIQLPGRGATIGD